LDHPPSVSEDRAGKIYVAGVRDDGIAPVDDMNGTNWTTFP